MWPQTWPLLLRAFLDSAEFYRPRRALQKAAPRNFDAFFAKGQKKTVEFPAVPCRASASRFCNARLRQGDPSLQCRNQAAETKGVNAMTTTKTLTKADLAHMQTIALTQLVPSAANVRKTGTKTGIEELAASIAAHGLLQNLQVRPVKGGSFEVVAGGRRLAALKLLAKQKKIAPDYPVPCHALDEQDATEISLAENEMREAMHPADQFEAFKKLADDGTGPEEIAARFGTTPKIVTQRLKLAVVSPKCPLPQGGNDARLPDGFHGL
jgi:ParB/RepB/Spo0J family partition protein